MPNNMFKRGYDAVKKEKERQDKAREESGTKLWTFYLKEDGDEASIRFLTEEPMSFNAHVLKEGKNFETIVCTGDDCEHCAEGDKPSFKSAFLIVDRREYEYTDRKTNKKIKRKGQIRLYIVGTRIASQLENRSTKYGLDKCDYTVTKMGSGQDTTYSFDREEASRISPQEIENLLPDKLREKYNGKQESLYDILEDQLRMMVSDYSIPDVDEDEDVQEERERRRKTVEVLDDDEDVYERKPSGTPKKTTPPKLSGRLKAPSKPKRNSGYNMVDEDDDPLPF